MKHLIHASVAWLRSQHGKKADAVRLAYHRAFPDDGLVMKDLARLCHAGETTFVEGDAVTTAFREGQRSILLHVAAMKGLSAGDLLALPYGKETDE